MAIDREPGATSHEETNRRRWLGDIHDAVAARRDQSPDVRVLLAALDDCPSPAIATRLLAAAVLRLLLANEHLLRLALDAVSLRPMPPFAVAPRPSGPLRAAMDLLCRVHTASDPVIGYLVGMGAAPADRDLAGYLQAWETVRRELGLPVGPGAAS